MVSDEGLNAYGASTWGQFFIYQGFNDSVGWMHTSSGVDDTDEYLETVEKAATSYVYKHGSEERPVARIRSLCRTRPSGHGASRVHGLPHAARPDRPRGQRQVGGVRADARAVKALTQSYTRTKAKDYKSFRQSMELHTNSSNNTIFADADGDIAYFHGNFIPKRDTALRLDEAGGRQQSGHRLARAAVVRRDAAPAQSGERLALQHQQLAVVGRRSEQPEEGGLPAYVDSGSESARGLHAMRVLENRKDFTLDSLIAAATTAT